VYLLLVLLVPELVVIHTSNRDAQGLGHHVYA
jgi:hypothetical protein